LTSQVTELRALPAQRGYEVVAEFLDEGASGTKLNRPALTRLRDVVQRRAVDGILVHDPDRLARELTHQLLLTEEFERAGVRLEYLTAPPARQAETTRASITGPRPARLDRRVALLPGPFGTR
jgi:DNA invertase Pin-like site-specific DNA recombinase